MRPASRRTSAIVLVAVLTLLASSSLGSTGASAHAAPVLSNLGRTAATPLLWANTSVTTLDPRLANNTGFNFTFSLPAGSLAANQFLTVNESEYLGPMGYASVGFTALDANGPTLGSAFVTLPNGTTVMGPENLTFPGPLNLSFEHARGWWWNATVSGYPLTGAAPWQNGTYLLGTAEAQGVVIDKGAPLSGPAVVFGEGGTNLPLDLVMEMPTVIGITNGTTSLRAANGELLDAVPSADTAPVCGQNQSSGIPPDVLVFPGPTPTTVNGAALWGNLSHTHLLGQGLVGAYTNDTEFGGNVTTGISFTSVAPNPLPAGDVLVGEVSLPLTTTNVLDIGFTSLNYEGVFVTMPEVVVLIGGQSPVIYLDTWALPEVGDIDTITAQEVHGPWWNVTINGATFVSYSGIGGSSDTNGTLNLGVDRALGVNDRPFYANLSFATQPVMFTEGNVTPLDLNTSWQLQADQGAWTTPSWGMAWSSGNTTDVVLGDAQLPNLAPGSVVFLNSTTADPRPLANGTVLWRPGATESLSAGATSLFADRSTTVTAAVDDQGVPVAGLTLTGTASVGGSWTPFVWSASSGTYTATFTAPNATHDEVDILTVTAAGPSLPVDLSEQLTMDLAPMPALTLQAGFAGSTSQGTVVSGESLLLTAFVNATGLGPVAGAHLTLLSNVTGGQWGAVSSPSPGEYQVTYAPPAVADVALLLSATAPLDLPSNTVSLSLSVTFPLLVVTSPTVSGKGSFTSGTGTFALFANVSAGGAPVAGAEVTFTFSPALPGGAPSPVTTDAAGTAELVIPVPVRSSVTTYTVSAEASAEGRTSGTAPSTVTFTVGPAPSTAVGSASAGDVIAAAAVIGVLGALLGALTLRRSQPTRK